MRKRLQMMQQSHWLVNSTGRIIYSRTCMHTRREVLEAPVCSVYTKASTPVRKRLSCNYCRPHFSSALFERALAQVTLAAYQRCGLADEIQSTLCVRETAPCYEAH